MTVFKNRIPFYFFHLMVWVVLFSLPYLLSTGQNQILINIFAHSWVPLILFALIFYTNYLLLIDHFLFKKKNHSFFNYKCVVNFFFYLVKRGN